MKFLNFLLFFTITFLTYFPLTSPCRNNTKQDDQTILKYLKENFNKMKNEDYELCTDLLIKSNHFASLEYLLKEMTKSNIKVKDMLNNKIKLYNNNLNELKEKYRFKEHDYKKVSPYLRWAQSKEYIVVEIKFSEDSSIQGCTEVDGVMFDVPQSNIINMQAYCNQYNLPIKYELTVLLSKDINKLRSTWGFDKDGNYQATLRKLAIEKWDDLFKSGVETPANVQRWVEIEVLIAKQEGVNNYQVKESSDVIEEDIPAELNLVEDENSPEKKRARRTETEFTSFMNNGRFKLAQ